MPNFEPNMHMIIMGNAFENIVRTFLGSYRGFEKSKQAMIILAYMHPYWDMVASVWISMS
jgi:hypothetical protein